MLNNAPKGRLLNFRPNRNLLTSYGRISNGNLTNRSDHKNKILFQDIVKGK